MKRVFLDFLNTNLVMSKKLFIVIISIISTISVKAQMRADIKRKVAETCVSGSIGYYDRTANKAGNVSIHYLWGLGRGKQIVSLGFGLRSTIFATKNRYYTTSSIELSKLNPGGEDTLFMPKVQSNTLNGYFTIQFHIKKGVYLNFNTDIGGIVFADSKTGYFQSYETSRVLPGIKYTAEPYAFNMNLFGDNSYGSLMNEAYFSFRCSNFLRWRLGFQQFRNEYKTTQDVPLNGRRFSEYHYMFTSGLAFNIRQHKTTTGPTFF